jgi:GNAT superfamily N-acetyltransferase
MTSPLIRAARPGDEDRLFELIRALAEYEKLSHAVTGSAEALRSDLFGAAPSAEALLCEVAGEAVGFALFFRSYSTFLTRPGIYLEDLFVLEAHRHRGLGSALLSAVARLAVERNCGRLEWSVLDWNASAIAFYQSRGATVLPDWRICRVLGEELKSLAARTTLSG